MRAKNINRKILFLASLPSMATPFISLIATPVFAASLYSQPKVIAGVWSTSNSRNSVLVSSWSNKDWKSDQERRQNLSRDIQHLRQKLQSNESQGERRQDYRRLQQDMRQLQDLRRQDYNRDYRQDDRDRNYNQDYRQDDRYRNYNPDYRQDDRDRNYNPDYR